MNIAQAQQEIQRLWGLYQAHQIAPEAYTEAVNQLQITDEAGNFWHVDGATQKWYRYVGQSWVEQAPPAAAAAPAPAPASLLPLPTPPTDFAPLPAARSRTPLWIGIGAAALVIIVLAALALTGAFSGGKPAATVPTPTLAAAQLPTAAAVSSPTQLAALSPTPIPPKKAPAPTVVPPTRTLPPAASPTIKPPATKQPQKPTATRPQPTLDVSTLLDPAGPWLLARDADHIYLIQATSVDSLDTEWVVGPESLADMIAPSGGRLAFISSADPDRLRGLHLNIYNLAQHKMEKIIDLTTAKTDPPVGAMPGDDAVEAIRSITEQTSIAWSPDGRTLAFIGVIDGPSSDLYSYNLDTGKILHLTDGPAQAYGPSWSPDGKYILQFGATGFGTGAGYVMAGAWVARADNSGVTSLYTPTSSGESTLGWLDANDVLVYGFNMMCGSNGIRKVTIQPLKVTTLLPGCFTNAAYDPTTHTIALTIDQVTSEGPGQPQSGLYLLKTDGTLQLLAPGNLNWVTLPAKTGAVWGYVTNQGAIAYTKAGKEIKLPAGAPQQPPVPAPDGKTWSIGNGIMLDNTPGLWIGPVSGGAKQVYTGAVSASAWSSSGAFAFMSDSALYFAVAPAFQPVLFNDNLTATELAWVK